jgi:hypothetical protein
MIVECKSYDVELSQKSVQQASVYNTTIKAPYIAVSNGMKHVCFQMGGKGDAIQLNDFPPY